MIVLIDVCVSGTASHCVYWDGIGNPFVKENLLRSRERSQITVKLYLEEVSLHQGIYGDSLVVRLSKALSCYRQRHFTLLEIEVDGCEDSYNGFGWISRVEGAVCSRYVVIEITLRNTIQ